MGVVDDLARAREAFERREWISAYSALADLDSETLDAEDLSRLATSAYLLGHRNDCVQALQRAHQASLEQGDPLGAARAAGRLAMVLIAAGETAVGGGWVRRCQRLLDDVEGDVVERGYLAIHLMYPHIGAGDYDAARDLAVQVADYGHRFADADLMAMGLMAQGRMEMYLGRVPEGLAMLDEAMVGVATGEVSPLVAGDVYCSLIEACQEVSDFGRAAEWTSALTAWVDDQPGLVPYTGQCAVHRGQILRVHGELAAALEELERAVERYLSAGTPAPAGLALKERGDILVIRGELDAAREAYERALALGGDPQPGLAMLWLAAGRTDTALTALRRLLADPLDAVHRSRLLPPAIDALVATGGLDEAAPLVEELDEIARSFGCAALRAWAAYAGGALRVARGDASGGLHQGRAALAAWQLLDAPYEASRCRVLIGRALGALGDPESAQVELATARQCFSELGAVPAEREVAALLSPSRPDGLTEREVEVLRLVASGRTNPEIAAVLFLSEKTVARHLSNIFVKVDVSSRTAAAAYAFEHRLV
ncbi:MAG TPA: LuxR C-terminal-related transcriptional regulator [Nocardioides sp.]|uniref:LuxR C-terminal-related transcriptional regulator n=1 Tax=Nocardioides sp. TaxID=35761 RepID=UPI002E324F54|nr:LuxR C-terminal-related transcriptional regulator [Nocardioides sp.]HEX5086708.1 LuxR C-terminal-related transcriptional regulator [Nocardioides sp.]